MIPKPTKPIIITGGAFLTYRGGMPCEPDLLDDAVARLRNRDHADNVMTKAFQNCDVTKDVNEQIDDALRAEIKRLGGKIP